MARQLAVPRDARVRDLNRPAEQEIHPSWHGLRSRFTVSRTALAGRRANRTMHSMNCDASQPRIIGADGGRVAQA